MLSTRPIPDDQVAVLLDGLLDVLIDGEPAIEWGPGAVLDPSKRSLESKQHARIRAHTAVRLALLPRDGLDSDALLHVGSEQTSRLHALLEERQAARPEDE